MHLNTNAAKVFIMIIKKQYRIFFYLLNSASSACSLRFFFSFCIIWLYSFVIMPGSDSYAQQSVQKSGNSFIGASFYSGKVLVASPKAKHLNKGYSQTYELSYITRTSGNQAWQQKSNYPYFTLAISYAVFGYPDILGEAIGILPSLTFDVIKRKKISLQWGYGFSVAYLTKKFNIVENPTNTVISTNVNNIQQMNLNIRYTINNRLNFALGGSLTHYSNGAYKLPNLGINVPTVKAGIFYKINATDKLLKSDTLNIPVKKEIINIQLASGVKEYRTPGGPKYLIHGLSVSVSLKKTYVSNFHLGTDLFFDGSTYNYLVNTSDFESEELKKSFKGGFFMGYEFMMNKMSITLNVGHYFYNPYLRSSWIYQRWNYKYYLNNYIFISMHLKSHLFVADVITSGIGVRF